uniref:LUC7-like protein n=1 Tax=Plectus sambesii TaxID=2011161 RepID=A0A914VEH5_9BILA
MSAVDQMRDMINQLMGTDPSIDDGRERMPFTDARICRNFLLGCCPHDVLASTRMDMGECQKIHDVALRADFERSQKEKDYFYDLDAYEVLERFFYDCDRKMEIAKKKLAETQEELSQEATEKAEKVLELNENIGKTLAEAEKLGNEGRVEESLALMEKLETLKKEKQDADVSFSPLSF